MKVRTKIKLSHRLSTIASLVEPGSRIADVGTDHGYIPIYLVLNQIARSAIAMDIRKGPLERAQSHIAEYGLENQIETRLSDGISALKSGDADTIMISGMGGEVIIHILEEGIHLWEDIREWILSPHSELEKVRHYLENHNFLIKDEVMLYEEGKYYTVMKVVRGEQHYEHPWEYIYGQCLIRKKDPVLFEYLKRECWKIKEILKQVEGNSRELELKEQLRWIEEAEHAMQ